jgi:hypothetical protein
VAANFDPMVELGVSGARVSGGRVHDEFVRELRGRKGRELLREMADNDPVVGAILFGIERLIVGLEWRVVPSDDGDAEAIELAEFIDGCRSDMSTSWEDIIGEVLTMLVHGFAPLETIYKRRVGPDTEDGKTRSKFTDGQIGWRKMALRAQETVDRWDIDTVDGSLRGMFQMDPTGTKGNAYIPIEKMLLFRTTMTRGTPEGRSVLRNAYRPWTFKKLVEEVEVIGIDRDLAGYPVAYLPPEYLATDAPAHLVAVRQAVEDVVTGLRRNEDEGALFPMAYDDNGNRMFELTLLSSGGSRQFDTGSIVARYDQRMAMTVLADFILLGHEKVGSYNLGSTKVDLFGAAIESWCRAIAGVFNSHAIPRLLRLNGMNSSKAPTVGFGSVGQIDVEAMVEAVAKMAQVGAIIPDEMLENSLRTALGLPLPDPDVAEAGRPMPGAEGEQ